MPKQRLIIKWRKVIDPMGIEVSLRPDSFFCKSVAGALEILSRGKKSNVDRAIFYDEYGEHREVFTGRKKIWDIPVQEAAVKTLGWFARLIRWLRYQFGK